MGLPKGRFLRFDPNAPQGAGVCDLSGMYVNYADLVKQMEYRGKGLVWTGLWVAKQFADEPNPQNLTPVPRGDPKPFKHARPWNYDSYIGKPPYNT